MPYNMTADHILAATAGGAYEPQRLNNFIMEVDELGEEVRLALQTLQFPRISTNKLTIHYMNEMRWWAGKTTYEDITFGIFDAIDKAAYGKLLEWHGKMYNPRTGCIDRAVKYKKQGKILLLDGCGATVRTWTCIGVGLINISPGQGNMEGDGALNIDVTMPVDKVFLN